MKNNFRIKRILKYLGRTLGIKISDIHYIDGMWILIDNKQNIYQYDEYTNELKIISKEV